MATRSMIGIQNPDGTVLGVYCHSDGYPSGVGATLQEHYQDEAKVRELVGLGDLSYLGDTTAQDDTCSYHRWRGEEQEPWSEVGPKEYSSPYLFADAANSVCDYVYLFAGGQWEGHRTGRAVILWGEDK